MWIFTTQGFASVVKDTERKARKSSRGAEWLLLRCRTKNHIQSFERMLKRLGWSGMHSYSPNRDYAYRLSLTRDQLAKLMVYVADDVDYPNFKVAASAEGGDRYHDALTRVWSSMQRLQLDEQDATASPLYEGLNRR